MEKYTWFEDRMKNLTINFLWQVINRTMSALSLVNDSLLALYRYIGKQYNKILEKFDANASELLVMFPL